jgi:seryl-tRNA synthetase
MTDFGKIMVRYTELGNNRAELLFEIEEKQDEVTSIDDAISRIKFEQHKNKKDMLAKARDKKRYLKCEIRVLHKKRRIIETELDTIRMTVQWAK